jgi:hypothetical protein
MRPDPDRQALIDQMTECFRKQLEQNMPDDQATLDQIEDRLDKIGQGILGESQQRLVNRPRPPGSILEPTG